MIRPAALLLLAIGITAAQWNAPLVIPRDHGAVAASTASGGPRWSADWTMEPWTIAGRKAVRFTETGKGYYAPFSQEVRWSMESFWLADGKFFPLQFEKTIRDTEGKTLAIEKKVFDPAAGTVKFERRDGKGVTETASFSAAPGILAIEGIAGILEFFPFSASGSAAAVNTHLLSNEPRLYDITIEARGTERLKTAGGDIDCYKIELVPHLGLLNVFKPFYPKTYFWFSVAAPHRWVRYRGLENGPGSPEIVMEAR